ncbi:hypothetical protein Hamer_G029350, partial [Homarus americanus]
VGKFLRLATASSSPRQNSPLPRHNSPHPRYNSPLPRQNKISRLATTISLPRHNRITRLTTTVPRLAITAPYFAITVLYLATIEFLASPKQSFSVILEYDPTMDAEEYPPKAVIWVPDQFIISVNLEMVSSRPQTITHMLPPATPCREPHRRHEDHRHEDHRRHEEQQFHRRHEEQQFHRRHEEQRFHKRRDERFYEERRFGEEPRFQGLCHNCSELRCRSRKRENNSHIDCGCPREKKIPVLELEFIKAQRTKAEGQGSMQMGSIDCSETKKQIANAKKREQIREREQKKKMKSEEAIQREEELCQD